MEVFAEVNRDTNVAVALLVAATITIFTYLFLSIGGFQSSSLKTIPLQKTIQTETQISSSEMLWKQDSTWSVGW